jgi:hypothetical protein
VLFISYRRKRDEDLAARIVAALEEQFEVFRDVDDLVLPSVPTIVRQRPLGRILSKSSRARLA